MTVDSKLKKNARLRPFSQSWNHRLVARIAVFTLPVRINFLAEVLENVARAALGGLTELYHRPQLLLIHRAPLFVVLQVRAEIDRGQVVAEPLPLPAAMLSHQTVPLEQRKND